MCNRRYYAALLATSLLLSACSGPEVQPDPLPEDINLERQITAAERATLAQEEAEAILIDARRDALDVYTPKHWREMEALLAQLRQATRAAHDQLAQQLGQQIADQANTARSRKAEIEAIALPMYQGRQALDDIQADKIFPQAYQRLIERLLGQAEALETGDEATDQTGIAQLVEDMSQLERDTVMARYWVPARDALKQAVDEQAAIQAPASYQQAELIVLPARQRLLDHYQDHALVASIGRQAVQAARKALFTAREAQKLQGMNIAEAEQAVLDMQKYLANIGQPLDSEPLTHMLLRDQSLALAQKVRELKANRIAPLEEQIERLQLDIENLKAQLNARERQQAAAEDTLINHEMGDTSP